MRSKRAISEDVCERIELIRRQLLAHYGTPELRRNEDAMGELISTILAQHTTDANSWRAYLELRDRFPVWEEVLAVDIEEVIDAIRVAGLAKQKATTIRAALADLDGFPLESLTELSVPEARARLTSIRGIGDKTASIVLLFALGMPAQPVDTHIERVSKRLGITNGESTATGIQHVYEHCLPADSATMYAFHVSMIRHGREICHARGPQCDICILRDNCDYYAQVVEPMREHRSIHEENTATR